MTIGIPCTTGCKRPADGGGLFCSSCARKLYVGDRYVRHELFWFLRWFIVFGFIGWLIGGLAHMVKKAHAEVSAMKTQSLTDDQYVEFSRDYDARQFP